MDDLPLGFVGLGDMGSGMATNLAKACGDRLMVHDLRPQALRSPVAAGALAAPGFPALVRHAEHIHVCLVYEEQIIELLTGPDGLLEHGRAGQLVVLHSTMLPTTVLRLAQALQARGIDVIDAPVSGGDLQAATGTAMQSSASSLTIMVGGSDAAVARAMPFLRTMGTVFHVGPLGAGEATKLANSVMNFCNRIAYLEGLQIAEAYGVDEGLLNEVVSRSTGASYAQKHRERNDRRWKHHTFSAEELPYRYSKDLRFAAQLGLDRLLSIPVTALCAQIAPDVYAKRWARMKAKELGRDNDPADRAKTDVPAGS
ncbi:MAG: NAD(P)-dependent oxidoreductase [Lautropia sp.]